MDNDPDSGSRQLLAGAAKLMAAASEEAYREALSGFLARLACQDKVAAKGLIRSRLWFVGASCLQQKTIAKHLLKRKQAEPDQCPGLTKLDAVFIKLTQV